MNAKIRRGIRRRKQRMLRRLERNDRRGGARPMVTASNIQYELAERARGTAYGGIAAIHLLARRLGLPQAIDARLELLKVHRPYHESDHVLHLAYNALCEGTCLEDLELRRQDEAYLDALGARRLPDPTTAGDFCRRFRAQDVRTLLEVYHQVRHRAWARQPTEFFQEAVLDLDGTIVETGGACKEGIDIAYNGTWGYHPLVVSLANTGEVLSLLNRSGNRPSHEGAAAEWTGRWRSVSPAVFGVCSCAATPTSRRPRTWTAFDADARVRFLFGLDVHPKLHLWADDLERSAWRPLVRPPRYEVETAPRARPRNVKEEIVRRRGFENIRLLGEEVAEFDYRPHACRKPYRIVAVRKDLAIERGQRRLFEDYRYFLYITNDWQTPAEQLVRLANQRCDQENLIAQLKGAVRSLHAPVDGLVSNWAWMAITALAWNLKAWCALLLPEGGRWQERQGEQKRRVLRMEFKTFVAAFMRLPCQVLRTGRRIVCRLLAWNPWQQVFFRLVQEVRHPLRC